MSFLDELRVDHETAHTRILRWLLDPQGDHQLGASVLSAFMRKIAWKTNGERLNRAEIRIEERQDETRADIAIVTVKSYVLVENKIKWSAFSDRQIKSHISSGCRKAKRAGKRFNVVLLLPNDEPPVALGKLIATLTRTFSANEITWADIVQIFKKLGDDRASASPVGAPFIRAYAEFIERQILKKWKGFNMNVLTKEVVAAASTYLSQRTEFLGEFEHFCESVRAGLGKWRDTRFHRQSEDTRSNINLLRYRYDFARFKRTHVSLYFCLPFKARSERKIELYVDCWTDNPEALRILEKHKLHLKQGAGRRFGKDVEVYADEKSIWIGHSIDQKHWLDTNGRAAEIGVHYVQRSLARFLDVTEKLFGKHC